MVDYTSEAEIRAFFTGVKQALRCAEIRGILKLCRQRKEMIRYIELAKPLKMFAGGSDLANCLGKIMEEDVAKGDPLYSSLVISNVTGRPSAGYFQHARRLGCIVGNTPEDEEYFWANQIRGMGLDPKIADDMEGDPSRAPAGNDAVV